MPTRSQQLFAEAQNYLPGGVNSPVRAFRGVGGTPIFFERGAGAYLYDADGRRYLDYVGSWGPLIVGHAHAAVVSAVRAAAGNGLSFGAPTQLETRMAQRMQQLMPSLELLRLCNSGTEATMSALRVARGFTGRNKIIKFEGCYHGHADALLVKAGSGALTLGVPTSPGVPPAVAADTITLTYNDLEQVEKTFAALGEALAAVIVEPVAGNMNCIPPLPGFLQGLRDLCTRYGSVLIFDEVMTGFRVALGGAQALYNITPDLTTLGKVIGGGMPVGAFGGKRTIMEQLAPQGPIYQAGTLSGNPLAMSAGLATLELLTAPDFYAQLTAHTERLCAGIAAAAAANAIPLTTNAVGGMFGLFFSSETVHSYAQATTCDVERFKAFFHAMLDEGVYLAPSAFEAGFVSAAHSAADIEATIEAAQRVLQRI